MKPWYTRRRANAKAAYSKAKRTTHLVAEYEADMIELCSPNPPINPSWSIGTGKDMLHEIKCDLEKHSYNLPPGLSTPPNEVFEMIVQRYNLLMDVAKDQHESILSNQAYITCFYKQVDHEGSRSRPNLL